MITKDFKPEWIRKLNEVSKQLEKVDVTLPSLAEEKEAKNIIEQILPPEEGTVTRDYVRRVLIALYYAETHFRSGSSMLNDIKAGKELIISEYKEPERK